MTSLPPVDPTRCPLCGQANQCAVEMRKASGLEQPPCWCTQVDFSRKLLAGVTVRARGLACVCVRCAQGGESG